MTVNDKLSALRSVMDRESLDAYIVSGTDPHNSEYMPDVWRQREWISGFTGSLGTVVVLKDDAGLWTDTRYFIQAEQQLQGSGIKLHKLRVPNAVDYPEWLATVLPEGSKVGVDSFCMSVTDMNHLKSLIESKGSKVIEKTDLLGDIWLDRPAFPETPIFMVPDSVSGLSTANKISMIRNVLSFNHADYFVFSALDEIAWLFNIRCTDVDYNPVAISYAVVGLKSAYLFIKRQKVSEECLKALNEEGVEVRDYHNILLFSDELKKDDTCCVDTNTLNYAIYNRILSHCQVKSVESPIIMAKAVKNPTEIEGFKKAFLVDSVVMSKFFYWLEKNISNHLTETQVSDYLTSLRAANDGYVSNSFENISAYGVNAALPHYSAEPGKDAELKPRGLYLVDSGGQYTYGTTDLTRTVPLGELTDLEKEDYTIVLKGMIDLACSIFPEGTRGCNIDAIARYPLWQTCRNFGHGTGHGVGFFLNVHEGPQAIRQDLKDQAIVPGMVTSDEPGLYREGYHGIRHENLLLCVPVKHNEFGNWYGFETLTLCYFDTTPILPQLLTAEELEWVNTYNKMVYEKTLPYLTEDEGKWLKEKTKPIRNF